MSGTPVFWLAAAVAVLLFWSLGAYNWLRDCAVIRPLRRRGRPAHGPGAGFAGRGRWPATTLVRHRLPTVPVGTPDHRPRAPVCRLRRSSSKVALRVARRQPLDV